jgi:hypothetical protein
MIVRVRVRVRIRVRASGPISIATAPHLPEVVREG